MTIKTVTALESLKNAYLDYLAGKQPGWILEVDEQSYRLRLDQFISKKIERISRNRASQLDVLDIQRECILKKSSQLYVGQKIWVKRPLFEDQNPPIEEPRIIDETDDFLVLYKPPHWAVHPTAYRFIHTITTWLKQNHKYAHPVHRLDSETSGILLCAKNKNIEGILIDKFSNHEILKTYLLIIEGISPNFFWIENTPLGFDPQSKVKIKMGQGNLYAKTSFKLLKTHTHTNQKRYSLIEAIPQTGRQHQIRAHLMLSGLCLLGDKLYGKDEAFFIKSLDEILSEQDYQVLGHTRHALHASKISFELNGQQWEWTCPLPDDLSFFMG